MKNIQDQINLLLNQDYVFEFEETGKAMGPVCDHCQKTGINLVNVYAYKMGQKEVNDPLADLVFVFGKTCLKKYKFTK